MNLLPSSILKKKKVFKWCSLHYQEWLRDWQIKHRGGLIPLAGSMSCTKLRREPSREYMPCWLTCSNELITTLKNKHQLHLQSQKKRAKKQPQAITKQHTQEDMANMQSKNCNLQRQLTTNNPAESPFASVIVQLQSFGCVLGIHSSGVGHAHVNGDLKHDCKDGTSDGAYLKLSPNRRQSLLSFALSIASRVGKSEKTALALDKQHKAKKKQQNRLLRQKCLLHRKTRLHQCLDPDWHVLFTCVLAIKIAETIKLHEQMENDLPQITMRNCSYHYQLVMQLMKI